jgi:hypothetical protein
MRRAIWLSPEERRAVAASPDAATFARAGVAGGTGNVPGRLPVRDALQGFGAYRPRRRKQSPGQAHAALEQIDHRSLASIRSAMRSIPSGGAGRRGRPDDVAVTGTRLSRTSAP